MEKKCLIKAMKGGIVAGLIGFSVIAGSFWWNKAPADFLASILPSKLLTLTNEVRAENNLSKLKWSDKLQKAAQLKAKDMAEKGYFAHTSPEGVTPWEWFKKVEYDYMYAGENLAVNFDSNEAATEAWLKSAKHRANIEGKQFKEIGIATARGNYKGKSTVFVVVLFGTPMPVLEANK